jgi:hypothetical protein
MQRHILPGEEGGDTAWFHRQNPFEQQEIYRQVAFKRGWWPHLPDGAASKRPTHTYPHVLPAGRERLAFYEPLADDILSYLAPNDIAVHSELLNLKSSQAPCLNFLFPLCQDLDLARVALRPLLPGLREVTGIEFEYTGPDGATEWLGEPSGGKRGQNRTSIDAAIFWIGRSNRKHVTLGEWKYTEHNFGVCSAFRNASTEGKARCRALDVPRDRDPARSCLLTTGGDRRSRRYWEHVEAAGTLSGQVAWADDSEVTSRMPGNGAVTLTPTTAQQSIAAGYHNSSGTVERDANLTADNIRGGVSVFGVDGTLYAPGV